MKRLLLILTLFVVVGCQTTRQTSQQNPYTVAWDKSWKILSECNEMRKQGVLPNNVASAGCHIGKSRPLFVAAGHPHMDLIDILFSYSMVVAEKLDAGTITKAEANLMMAEKSSEILGKGLQREAASRGTLQQQPNTLQKMGTALQKYSDALQKNSPPAAQPTTQQAPRNCSSQWQGNRWVTVCY